jgi:uncharacterized protein YjbI with pentapeptide repeats
MMEGREHLLLLFRSIALGNCRAWNDWRIENPGLSPKLMGLELWEMNLPFLNLSRSDLRLANLHNVNLFRANIEQSDLSMAILKNVDFREANLKGSKLYHANLRGSDLRHADLSGADLRQATLIGSRIDGADLTGAIFDEDALNQTADFGGEGVGPIEKLALRITGRRTQPSIPAGVLKSRRPYHASLKR